ncbi:MAG: DUF2442 domain-containing protein [Bacteroidetes bacterium]|nr:DUF2442 domain-containing protein [Bacteroidota bacterium]
MKILVEYNECESGLDRLKIDSAEYLSNYALRLLFNDGTERLVDFKPFLSKSLHPSIKKYLDEDQFTNFSLTDGNLNWNDYELIFPIWNLYNGKIDT